MPESDLLLPPIQFPILGNSGAIGLFSLLHIALAGITVGFIVLAPALEYLGIKDPFYTRLGRSLVRFVAVVFSVSAVFAVIMVELFIGLFPVSTVAIFQRFKPAVYIAIGVFLLHIWFFYTYWYRWEKTRAKSIRRHIALGAAAAVLILMWGALLDGIGSSMLTPGEGDMGGPGRSDFIRLTFLTNPTWAPLVLHRFLGVLIISFYAIALYGGVQLLWRKPKGEEEAYYTRVMHLGMVIGTGLLLIQPIAGMLYSFQIGRANPRAYERILFELEWLLRVQFLLIGLLFYLSNQFFAQISSHPRRSRVLIGALLLAAFFMVLAAQQVWIRRGLTLVLILMTFYHLRHIPLRETPPHPRGAWLAISVGFCAVATFLVMGVIREQARRPYTVYEEIHLEDEKQPASELAQR